MDLSVIENEMAAIVTRMYELPALPHYSYHNLAHTCSVVKHAGEIAHYYSFSKTDTFIVTVAAWFHDVGHLYGDIKGHEFRSVGILQQCQPNLSPDLTRAISRCILATELPSHPSSLHEQIVCDADTYHLGTSLFPEMDRLVKQEMESRTGKTFPDWKRKTLCFLRQHQFYTDYCQSRLNVGKQANIDWLEFQPDLPSAF